MVWLIMSIPRPKSSGNHGSPALFLCTVVPGGFISMSGKSTFMLPLAVFLFAASAWPAEEVDVYVVTAEQQFGIVNLTTGAFRPIGSGTPEPDGNLVRGAGGMLFSLASLSGNLVSINPGTGATTVIGPTGLGSFAFALAGAGGRLYLTDFDNNLYHVDAATGTATLIGPTGIPRDPGFPPGSVNPDGTLNFCGETFYGVGDKIYATFHAFRIDPVTLAVSVEAAPKLWEIDPHSGLARLIGETSPDLLTSVRVDGRFYAFRSVFTAFSDFGPVSSTQLYSLDIGTGKATFLRNIDPAAGPIFGATPVHD
jgi:outer membrane protein assembly factor BamB